MECLLSKDFSKLKSMEFKLNAFYIRDLRKLEESNFYNYFLELNVLKQIPFYNNDNHIE